MWVPSVFGCLVFWVPSVCGWIKFWVASVCQSLQVYFNIYVFRIEVLISSHVICDACHFEREDGILTKLFKKDLFSLLI